MCLLGYHGVILKCITVLIAYVPPEREPIRVGDVGQARPHTEKIKFPKLVNRLSNRTSFGLSN